MAVTSAAGLAVARLRRPVPSSASASAGLPTGSSVRPSITARPGQNPPFSSVKHPARPYKSAAQIRFTMDNAKAAETPRAGPDGAARRAPRARRRSRGCPAWRCPAARGAAQKGLSISQLRAQIADGERSVARLRQRLAKVESHAAALQGGPDSGPGPAAEAARRCGGATMEGPQLRAHFEFNNNAYF